MNPKQTLEKSVYAFAAGHAFTGLASITLPPDHSTARQAIYKGMDTFMPADEPDSGGTQNRKHPSLTIIADGEHEEIVKDTKNFRGTLVLRVEADAQNKTDADFDTLARGVFAVFDITTLPDNFTQYAQDAGIGFYCYQADRVSLGDTVNNGVNWQKDLVIDCVYAEAIL